MDARDLRARSDHLFSKKAQLDTLHQRIAEEFYPERSDFTRTRYEGEEFADRMYESTPALNRRDLANAMGAVLRPRGKSWFSPRPSEEWRLTDRARAWLDYAKQQMRNMLYSAHSGFQHAMPHGDHDFVTFGNKVIGVTEGRNRRGPFFEMFHIRDSAWSQDRYRTVNELHRKIKIPAITAAERYGEEALTSAQRQHLTSRGNPFTLIDMRHIVLPSESFEGAKASRGKAFTALLLNDDCNRIVKRGGYTHFPYLVARWMSADADNASSAYGYSPAAMLGLVDARLLQQQARIILDAGERVVDPPMIATREAVLGGINTFSGSVNWVDYDYDERMGPALRALETKANIPIGLEMKQDTRAILRAIWYLDKLSIPSDKDMTATEVNQLVAEYIRSAGPVFEPFERDNAALLDILFGMSLRNGWLGDVRDIPRELLGASIDFEFDTPIQQAYQRQKIFQAQETLQFAAGVAQQTGDMGVFDNFDIDQIVRDVSTGIGGEAKWVVPVEARDQARQQRQQAMQQQEEMRQGDVAIDNAGKLAETAQKMPAALQGIYALQNETGPMDGGAGDDGLDYPRDPLEPADEMEMA